MIPAVIERGAGIDVGRKFIDVCLMAGEAQAEPKQETRRFSILNEDLERMRQWLKENHVTHVAMESTGSYWRPIHNVLDDGEMEVVLANSQHVRNLRGHKTDRNDARWLAHLLRHGMIRPSFIPNRETRELRDLTRRRKQMVGCAAEERNRVQRVLQEANVQLGTVLSDVFGDSGLNMLDALMNPEATAEQIAELAQSVNGIKETAAASIIAETGADITQFPTDTKLSSWIGTCPGNNITGGKRKSAPVRKGNPWACRVLVECAWSATRRKDSEAQRYYEHLKQRHKHKPALVATAHLLTLQLYETLATGNPYQEKAQADLPESQLRRLVRHHSHRLSKLKHWLNDHRQRCAPTT